MRKGVISHEMFWKIENKCRFEDSLYKSIFRIVMNSRSGKRQYNELKHLCSQRKRK